jgi:negative regulator of sigma-B (phosphoserine phosphatase)
LVTIPPIEHRRIERFDAPVEAAVTDAPLEWSVAEALHSGETISGDACLVATFRGGALVAVVDGLDWGPDAAAAAQLAVATLARHAAEPVVTLLDRCYRRLATTQGAALVLASFDTQASTMTWVGVGHVEAVLWPATAGRAPTVLEHRNGVVGLQRPATIDAAVLHVDPGDTLVVATDGVRLDPMALAAVAAHQPTALAARRLLEGHRRGDDDALVLVARWRCAA